MGPLYGKFPILFPYHSHKNPWRYGNRYGKLTIKGSHSWGSLKIPLILHIRHWFTLVCETGISNHVFSQRSLWSWLARWLADWTGKNAKPGGNAHQEVLVSNGGHDFYMIRWYLLFLMDSKQYVFGCKRRCWMNSWRLSTELLILTLYLRSKTRWTSGSSCLNAIGGLGFRGSVSLVGILDPLTLKNTKNLINCI